MNIASAKKQIENAVNIYLQKDALEHYKVPLVHQRPVFVQGAPGLGKTAIMRQISEELNIGLVTYSMTHHTRQSAIGLPMIVEREYGGRTYSVSEYTMSEIIASVYECMEKTGCKEGILFLDEINCISETLSPAMLLFLQYKTFGGHTLPEGWVVVTAGNQARYNKSVRDFDAATRDRLKYIVVEPDYESFKGYALQRNIARSIISYLDIRQDNFYVVETTAEGFSVVTPRSWEDLSQSIYMHEELEIGVDIDLISQYIQNKAVARDFSIYYELYHKYCSTYDIKGILNHRYDEKTVEEARKARLDERMTLVGLLLESVLHEMHDCNIEHDSLKIVKEQLMPYKDKILKEESNIPELEQTAILKKMQETVRKQAETIHEERETEILTIAYAKLQEMEQALADAKQEAKECKAYYRKQIERLKLNVLDTQKKIGNLLEFLKETFGEGSELGLAVNDLTSAPEAAAFIGQFLSMDYFEASNHLQLHRREEELLHQIEMSL